MRLEFQLCRDNYEVLLLEILCNVHVPTMGTVYVYTYVHYVKIIMSMQLNQSAHGGIFKVHYYKCYILITKSFQCFYQLAQGNLYVYMNRFLVRSYVHPMRQAKCFEIFIFSVQTRSLEAEFFRYFRENILLSKYRQNVTILL